MWRDAVLVGGKDLRVELRSRVDDHAGGALRRPGAAAVRLRLRPEPHACSPRRRPGCSGWRCCCAPCWRCSAASPSRPPTGPATACACRASTRPASSSARRRPWPSSWLALEVLLGVGVVVLFGTDLRDPGLLVADRGGRHRRPGGRWHRVRDDGRRAAGPRDAAAAAGPPRGRARSCSAPPRPGWPPSACRPQRVEVGGPAGQLRGDLSDRSGSCAFLDPVEEADGTRVTASTGLTPHVLGWSATLRGAWRRPPGSAWWCPRRTWSRATWSGSSTSTRRPPPPATSASGCAPWPAWPTCGPGPAAGGGTAWPRRRPRSAWCSASSPWSPGPSGAAARGACGGPGTPG